MEESFSIEFNSCGIKGNCLKQSCECLNCKSSGFWVFYEEFSLKGGKVVRHGGKKKLQIQRIIKDIKQKNKKPEQIGGIISEVLGRKDFIVIDKDEVPKKIIFKETGRYQIVNGKVVKLTTVTDKGIVMNGTSGNQTV